MNIFCPHFKGCSGCSCDTNVDHIKTIAEAKHFFLNCGVEHFKVHLGNPCHWRCRAKLAVRGTAKHPQIGLFEVGSHQIVDIPNCRVHHPLINEAVDYVRKWMIAEQIKPYDEVSGTGLLRYLECTVDRINKKIQLALVLNERQDDNLFLTMINPSLYRLWEANTHLWHSLWVNFNKRNDNVIIGQEWSLVFGQEWLWENFCGKDLCFHPGSFFQANPEMFERLLIELNKNVPHGANVVEFYAGGGSIGFTLVERCKKIVCNEIVPLAKKCFDESSKRLSDELRKRISFVLGSAESQKELLLTHDVVIVDPPRKGIDRGLMDQLCLLNGSKCLIYVSCGWKSFERDAKKLFENYWRLRIAEGFLFFPGSDHLEVLAIFDKEQ